MDIEHTLEELNVREKKLTRLSNSLGSLNEKLRLHAEIAKETRKKNREKSRSVNWGSTLSITKCMKQDNTMEENGDQINQSNGDISKDSQHDDIIQEQNNNSVNQSKKKWKPKFKSSRSKKKSPNVSDTTGDPSQEVHTTEHVVDPQTAAHTTEHVVDPQVAAHTTEHVVDRQVAANHLPDTSMPCDVTAVEESIGEPIDPLSDEVQEDNPAAAAAAADVTQSEDQPLNNDVHKNKLKIKKVPKLKLHLPKWFKKTSNDEKNIPALALADDVSKDTEDVAVSGEISETDPPCEKTIEEHDIIPDPTQYEDQCMGDGAQKNTLDKSDLADDISKKKKVPTATLR